MVPFRFSLLSLLILMLSAGAGSAMDGIAISTRYTLEKANSVHFPRFGNLIRYDIENDAVVKTTPIYTGGDAGFVCISPMGDRIAFTKRDGSIVVMSINGGEPTALLKIQSGVRGDMGLERAVPLLQWPYGTDGKWIYYIDVPGELRRVHVDTRATEFVVRFNRETNEFGLSLYARKNFGTFTCRPAESVAPIYDISRGDGDLYSAPTWTEDGSCGVSVSPDGTLVICNNNGHNLGRISDTDAKLKTKFTINQWAGAPSDGANQWQFFRWSVNSPDWIAVSQGKNMGFGGAPWDIDWTNAVLYSPFGAGKQIQLTQNEKGQHDIAGGLWVAGIPLDFALGLHSGKAPFQPPFPRDRMTGTWAWDYGDGTQGKDGTHTYTKAGEYAVKATQGEDVRYGRVVVKESRAPLANVSMLSPRRLLVLFDEPVQIEKGGATASLKSGRAAKGCRLLENPRQLLIELEVTLVADDAVTLRGVVDCAQKPNAVTAPLAVKWGGRPANDDKLVFRWESADAHNRILVEKDTRSEVCRIFPRENARFGRNGILRLKGGTAFVSGWNGEPSRRIMHMVRQHNAMTMEVVVHPAPLQQGTPDDPAGIFGLSQSCQIVQEGGELVFRYTGGGELTRVSLGKVADETPQHIVVACRPGKIVCYRNGKMVAEQAGDICRNLGGNWSPGDIQLGVAPNSKLKWTGGIEGVALYARYLDAAEVGQNYAAFAAKFQTRKVVPRVEVQATLLAITETPRPIEIAPYREALVVYEYEVEKVMKGTLKPGKIRVAHFGILNGKSVPVAQIKVGASGRLALEAFSDHPELESITLRDTLPEDFEQKLWVEAE
ncbi:MAG TPA: hypothetical protein VM186_08480 [Planctomycetota bacterium]|nr:hypothetical protein [Planctomycetota bacterium]